MRFKVRYTNEQVTLFVDDKEVFACPNPKPECKTRCGLIVTWGQFWFKDIVLKKL